MESLYGKIILYLIISIMNFILVHYKSEYWMVTWKCIVDGHNFVCYSLSYDNLFDEMGPT